MGFERDLKRSSDVIDSIKDDILPKLLNGDIISLETSTDRASKALDMYAGIDYIRKDSTGIQGIASRVQMGSTAWDTFTIRKSRDSGTKTEFTKRIEQINKGYLVPTFTLQAYYDDKKQQLLSIAVVKTEKLYEFIANNPNKVRENRTTNATFIIVRWQDLPKETIRIWRLKK